MSEGEESRRFEDLLRKRGVSVEGNDAVEKEILERYQDDCGVLVLDSSGFTRITQQHGIIHFMALVVALRDLIRPLFERFQAIGHWAAGDNLYAIFPNAEFATECALAILETLRKGQEGRAPTERLEVCIGIGAGRMLRIGREDIYGDPMNLASKLGEDIAGPGEILLTEAAYEEIKDRLPDVEARPCRARVSGVEIPYYSVRP